MPTPAAPNDFDAYATAHTSLRRQILRECEEMAEYAFASGLRVPAKVMQTVEAAVQASRESESGDAPYDATGQEIARLTDAHEQLAKVVSPATPRSLVILANHREDGSWIGFLGPVPFVRRMMIAAMICLAAFIGLPIFQFIDGDAKIALGVGGAVLFGNMMFLLSAAGLGASFAALFQSSSYIANRTWDPQYEITYWIKFIVGLMAGLMLCLLVPLEFGSDSTAAMYDKPLLALLGGFSASAVYRILDRLVETVESLVRGSTKEAISAAEEQARIRSQGQAEQLRLRMAAELMTLQQGLAGGGDRADVQRRLDSLLGTMIPDRTPVDDTPAVAPYTLVAPAVAATPLSSAQETASPAAGGAYHGDDESAGEEADEEATATATATATAPAAVPAGLTVSPVRAPADDEDDDGAVG